MPAPSGREREHRFTKIIPGDIDTVGERVAAALGSFNYVVFGGNPIGAKRDRRRNIFVGTILEYRTLLTIGLKPLSD